MSECKCVDCGRNIPMSIKQQREGLLPDVMLCPTCRDEAANLQFDDLRDALMDVGLSFIN